MCGRYYLILDPDDPEMQAILEKLNGMEFAQGEIAPGQMAPVLVPDGQGGWTPRLMQWGFPHWEKKSPVINARQETVALSPFFRPSFLACRCLVPGNWFFEWRHTPLGKATKDKMETNPQGSKLMYMAGVYKKLDDGREVFTIVTRPADKQVRPIHDRMPVMLTEEERRQAYLSGPAEAFVILSHMEDRALDIRESKK